MLKSLLKLTLTILRELSQINLILQFEIIETLHPVGWNGLSRNLNVADSLKNILSMVGVIGFQENPNLTVKIY